MEIVFLYEGKIIAEGYEDPAKYKVGSELMIEDTYYVIKTVSRNYKTNVCVVHLGIII